MITANKSVTNECPALVCVADEGYAMPLTVMLFSVLTNLKLTEKADIFVIDGGITQKTKEMVEKSLPTERSTIHWIKPSKKLIKRLENVPENGWLTKMSYYRLFIPDLLPETLDRVILLDSDLIVKGDITELWNIPLDNKYVLAVQNLDWKVSSPRGLKNYKQLGLNPDSKYFNSGVMVIDLLKWKAGNISQKTIEYIEKNKEDIMWCDQDGLNATLANHWKEIESDWNYEVIPNPYNEEKIRKSHIIHFTGPRKPWHAEFKHPTKKLFTKYVKQTAWANWKPSLEMPLQKLAIKKVHQFLRCLGLTRTQLHPFKIFLQTCWFKFRHLFTSSLQVKYRKHLPVLLNVLGLNGEGVEIGTFEGAYSETILKKSNLTRLYSVDPWKEFGKDEWVDIANSDQEKQYERYLITVKRLAKFKNRNRILRMTSSEAVDLFENESLDFIYIDAQHSYKACKEDIESWWPKLKKGGLFAGHDYLDGQFPEGDFGVKTAVDELVVKFNLKLYVTNEQWPTWYLIKE